MFFIPAKCPVNDEEKNWIEDSMLWLSDKFGLQTLLNNDIILPLPEYFPDPFSGTKEWVQKLVNRICKYMNTDPSGIDVEIYSEKNDFLSEYLISYEYSYNGTAGLYFKNDDKTRTVIAIESSKLDDPFGVVATIAHEIGHELILGNGILSSDEDDHEFMTDLVTVFWGMGIFTANAAFQFSQWQSSDSQGWKTSRQGYLSESMFAYALAYFAWIRGEHKPEWIKYLKANIRSYFKKGFKYLHKTGNAALPFNQNKI